MKLINGTNIPDARLTAALAAARDQISVAFEIPDSMSVRVNSGSGTRARIDGAGDLVITLAANATAGDLAVATIEGLATYSKLLADNAQAMSRHVLKQLSSEVLQESPADSLALLRRQEASLLKQIAKRQGLLVSTRDRIRAIEELAHQDDGQRAA